MPRQSTRRGFLGTIGALAGAAPLALAGATNPADAAPQEDKQSEAWRLCKHGVKDGKYGGHCPACNEEQAEFWDTPVVVSALVACQATVTALDRLKDGCDCEDDAGGWCGACRDADAFEEVYEVFVGNLDGNVNGHDCEGRMERAKVPNTAHGPHLGARLALWDLLDSLLDLTTGHCPHTDCWLCQLADRTAHLTNLHIQLLACEKSGDDRDERLAAFHAEQRRELKSAKRKVARERERQEEGGVFMPHTATLHAGAAKDVEWAERHIALFSKPRSRAVRKS